MQDLNEFLRENMKTSQAFYKEHAKRNRSPAPAYQVGDRVFLNAKNNKSKRPGKKLDWKNLEPFTITKVVRSHNYQLELPLNLKYVHHIFHTSLLRPHSNSPIPRQTNVPIPLI